MHLSKFEYKGVNAMPVLDPSAPTCTAVGCACPPTPETPYENWCCCPVTTVESDQTPPLTNFTCYYVMQPKCQLIPAEITGLDEDIASQNPCFINGRSYWTYKLFLPCAVPRPGLSHLVIPICQDIDEDEIRVFEKVDCCGSFRELSFGEGGALDIKNDFTNHGLAPEFFNWLKIDNQGAFSFGVCVTYLLSIEGNFQIATGPIELFQANTTGIFNCSPNTCFRVPGCIPTSGISVTKSCPTVAHPVLNANGTINATLSYQAVITNTGALNVTITSFTDNITIPAGGTFVSGTVTPSPQFTISGLGNSATVTGPAVPILLTPGQQQIINYNIVVNFASPGTYLFNNSATASGTDSLGAPVTANATNIGCQVLISRVAATKCCTFDPVTGKETFNITITSAAGSPSVNVNVVDQITIPTGLVVQFDPLDANCTASPAIVNPVTGPASFTITCTNVSVPGNGGSTVIPITLTVLSAPFDCQDRNIVNTVNHVTGASLPSNQVLIVTGLPATATAKVNACISCSPECGDVVGIRRL